MEKYDYYSAVREDVKEYILNNIDKGEYETREELEEYLNDELFTCDSVTGNASGSYTFNTWQAEENLCHNLELLGEALNEFGCDGSYIMDKGAESCDVTIRCYVLGSCIGDVLDEYEENGFFETDEEDED